MKRDRLLDLRLYVSGREDTGVQISVRVGRAAKVVGHPQYSVRKGDAGTVRDWRAG